MILVHQVGTNNHCSRPSNHSEVASIYEINTLICNAKL